MVDVTAKDVSVRTGRASGRVRVSARVVELLRGAGVPKGDALATARIAGIMAAKRTPDLVPLCHPIAIHGVAVDLAVEDDAVAITATVRTADRTGVEMEALTAVSVAALTVVDMVKAVDPGAVITDVRVEEKTGGVSGDWVRDAAGEVVRTAEENDNGDNGDTDGAAAGESPPAPVPGDGGQDS
ncbi:MAG: cyclic pyranopterin monophosphate synthase MoaC [Streptomycetaceae bacterium]|nr:cyclic pyranopterin monophosphate synthase MoaC [Streptomycetaceae bacterium]